MSDNNNRRQSQIEDKDGLSKYMKRVKTVLRRGSSAESSLNEPSSPGPGPSHSRTAYVLFFLSLFAVILLPFQLSC